MKLGELPIGNAFNYDLGTGVKVCHGEDCEILPCMCYGVVPVKRLVLPVGKVERYWLTANSPVQEPLQTLSVVEWGTIVRAPHKPLELLVTCGISLSGIIVAKLGNAIKVAADSAVQNLGYAGKHIGLARLA